MRLSIEKIAEYTDAEVISNTNFNEDIANTIITSVTWDSRCVEENSLYVALPGNKVDGHSFVCDAFSSGARCALVSSNPAPDMLEAACEHSAAILKVENTQDAMSALAKKWRCHINGRVVGLTGSVGKTTTKNLIRDVLASRLSVVATDKNQNNELGVPNTILKANPETQAVIVEMGMRGLGEIEQLCNIASPDWGVITNVGECHVELLGSVENVARAKAELPKSLNQNGFHVENLDNDKTSPSFTNYAFLNANDDYFNFIKDASEIDKRGVVCVEFDGSPNAESKDYAHTTDAPVVWATNITLNDQGQPSFLLHVKNFEAVYDGVFECAMTLRGAHNVSNACAAAAVAAAFGFSVEEICAALSTCKPESGRQEVSLSTRGFRVVNDAYNANPDSMCAALLMLASMQTPASRIAILGDMEELGETSRAGHARAGITAAENNIDFLVCVGKKAIDIYNAAIDAGMEKSKIAHVLDADDALDIVQEIVKPEDIVLLKASHAMQLDLLASKLLD